MPPEPGRTCNQLAIVLDKLVVSAPVVQAVINDGGAPISGTFTRDAAAAMARQLDVDALPFQFQLQRRDWLSDTLGAK